MKKNIFIFAFIFSIIILYVIFDFYILDGTRLTTKVSSASAKNACDLNLKDCIYTFNNEKISISINPKPIKALNTNKIKITIKSNKIYNDLKLRVYGINMFMGITEINLYKIKDNTFEGNIILSSCTKDLMRFKADVLENNRLTDFSFEFDVKKH
ncbi:hypothetical protein CNZW441b_0662 [Campylobacter novaezeelandiae]|uniref:Periplasmic protein n=1 Tax=Campylobacter novaezeelandiae TaxID=2267891 RepID=A0A4Q9JXJ5_9BACT|nr:hypothetical protein [Campylobacter novaezeelandiae]QWU79980.1 hypothetical protein CNZW441b_0662 [Campylobacter novaezeelandiae]TBR82441.1 hypothetical protein DU473_00955 [Campylobacter novaezeelandiae]